MVDRDQFDVVVLGSGFGGSLLSAILSREGMSVAMVDRAGHPRFIIGESSTPAADFLLQELATRHQLTELHPLVRFGAWRDAYPNLMCGCKRGFSYFWHAAGGGFQATANHQHELLVTANESRHVADTQWYRPDVDHFLARMAESNSVTCLEAAEVTDVEHPRPHSWTLVIKQDGKHRQLSASFLVDASGPAGVLMRRLPVQDWTDRLHTRSSAVYGHWNQVRPLDDWLESHKAVVADYPYPAQDSAVHHLFDDGWLWQLRFENGLTSLGYVFAGDRMNEPQVSAEESWASLIKSRPELSEILGQPQLAKFPGHLFRTGRLQRLFSSAAGDDWAALPFAVGFIDPLHSTGIAHMLSGVERLSHILLTTSGRQRHAALGQYSRNVVDELLHIDRLVGGCYDGLADFRLFTAWSMLYFAAATTFERRWLADPEQRPAFLCADDEEFASCVRALRTRLRSLRATSAQPGEMEVADFCDRVRDGVEPFNHVGLFEPAVPNMYRYTAAVK